MSFRVRYRMLAVLGGSLLCAAPAIAQDRGDAKAPPAKTAKAAKPEGTKFMRLTRDKDDELASMDTAIVRYVPKDGENAGLAVDLIGVVHIGEREYYEQLSKQFKEYDAVLYELVAPEGTAPAKGEKRGGHPIAMLQNGMKDVLELEYQLSHIDYRSKNFVHADMSPDDFAKSMADRGESMWTIFLRSLGHGLAQESKAKKTGRGMSDVNLLTALFSDQRALLLKRMMAEQFEDLESAMNAFNGPDGSTIITERNKVALAVLKKQIGNGKKKLAVFYGAGHMPDMEERLAADFDLKPAEHKWLVAWNLADPTAAKKKAADKQPAKPAAAE